MRKFSVVMPPDWVLLDLGADHVQPIAPLVDRMLRGVPAAAAQASATSLLRDLERAVVGMRDQGVAALAFPVASITELVSRPMVAFRQLEWPAGVEPIDMVVALAATEPSAELLDVEHLVALRTCEEADKPVSDSRGIVPPELAELAADPQTSAGLRDVLAHRWTRHVRYVLGDPNDRASWMDVRASISTPADAGGTELAEALQEVFDIMVRSFRWTA